jgi:predicted metal-dependent hydrolase
MYSNSKEVLKSEIVASFNKLYSELTNGWGITNPPKLTVRDCKTRWGSYSLKTNRIMLNSRLSVTNDDIIKYVIAHELCHIKHHNHGQEFHKQLDILVPNNRQLRKQLNEMTKTLIPPYRKRRVRRSKPRFLRYLF